MIDPGDYFLNNPDELASPSLILIRKLLECNLAESIRLCGGPDRWRPHVKTHKTREIVARQLELGVLKHKCATIAEAEMLAGVGVPDVLIAYPLVGPNINRLSCLMETFPATRFTILIDNPQAALTLADRLHRAGQQVNALLDLNPGMDRTGIPLNRDAIELYELIATTPGLMAGGLHWYDGQHRQADWAERRQAILAGWREFIRFRDQLLLSGFEVAMVVASGSGSFAVLAETQEPNLELSPGTTSLFDADCHECFAELNLKPAVAIFTRVVSHSGGNRLTLDIGHKACAADQPAGRRLYFPSIPDARERQHTEEHLVIETDAASQFVVGDGIFAISRHICPTMALHECVYVVEEGKIVDQWAIAARRRKLTI